MQSITKEYLLDIIQRKISTTIHLHRKRHPYSFNAVYTTATAEEVQEFIISIPYFDATLKSFLCSRFETQTIISQTWELEFVKKCDLWMQGYEWLYGKPYFLNEVYDTGLIHAKNFLTLPY
jgi:hypothetical protein